MNNFLIISLSRTCSGLETQYTEVRIVVKWCKGGKEPGVRTKTNPADPFPMPSYPDEPLPLYGFTVSDIVQERNQNN